MKMSISTTDLMYTVQDVPGKGKGLIASQDIPQGTRILSEEPIIRVPDAVLTCKTLEELISKKLDALGPYERGAFLSMPNRYPYDASYKYFNIMRSNALSFKDDVRQAGIFLAASRINHACDSNAYRSWNKNIKRHTVHALQNIEKGEEITFCYLDELSNREDRQKSLREKFAFTCSCRLCSLPPDQAQKSDKRLEELTKLTEYFYIGGVIGGAVVSAPLRVLRRVDRQIHLYREERLAGADVPKAFLNAAVLALMNGDAARARVFAEKANLGWVVLRGDDSPKVRKTKALSQDPSIHVNYGVSKMWKTTVEDVPQGLQPDVFDDWLWRREKQNQAGQLVDFRNRTTFPGFTDLPGENETSLSFYDSGNKSIQRPRRHWMFLAEIVEFTMSARLEMTVKDVYGKSVPLFFHTHMSGSELEPSQVQKRHTVAILYAQRHRFMFSEPGIRHEVPTNMKVLYHSTKTTNILCDF